MDGFGWLIDKRCRLMQSYGWSAQQVRTKIPGAQGWIYYHWATENQMTIFGSPIERQGKGYVAQEAERIRRKLRRHGK